MVLNKNTVMLACDFETTVYENQTSTEVWSAAYARLFSDKVVVLHSIEEFLKELFDYRVNVVCWFHNEKFDGSFIVNFLLRNGWEWTNNKKLEKKQFTTLISKQNRWYTITIFTGKSIIEIRDSAKLMPMSLEDMGVAFDTKHRKKEMKYKGYRYAGCNITKEEMEYIINDVLVLKEALEFMFGNGHRKLTIGSCALSEYKKIYGKYEFITHFPKISDIELSENYGSSDADEYVRKSYKGGWCYLKKGVSGRVGQGFTLDVNSLYPSMMHSCSDNVFPIGKPHFWKGDIPDGALKSKRVYFVRFECRFELKENYLPTVQIKGDSRYDGTEWLHTSRIKRGNEYFESVIDKYGNIVDNLVILTMTHVDFILFKEHYDIKDLKILDGCWFYGAVGLFDDYIDEWANKKINAESKGQRTEAKLFLNNLYGKFSTSRDSSYRIPYLRADNSLDFELVTENNKEAGYIPVGSMITSYSRNFTIRRAQLNYEQFLYGDTDSLHMIDKGLSVLGIDIHPTNLLCWKFETEWSSGIFLRQKTYAEFIRKKDGKKVYPHWSITCAGMPDNCKNIFLATHPVTDFKYGLTVNGKLTPTQIDGGVLLKDSVFTLRKKR